MRHLIASQHFMEPEGSIPNSQELSTCSYPEPDKCLNSSLNVLVQTANRMALQIIMLVRGDTEQVGLALTL
jgi:hypothetical protein